MRTNQTNKTKKPTRTLSFFITKTSFLPATDVVLTLAPFKRKGGEI